MIDYRLYSLDGNGKIQSAQWLSAADDDDVLAKAEALGLRGVTEIWDHQRFVAKLPKAPAKPV